MNRYIKGTWTDAIVDESGHVIQPGTVIRKADMERIENALELLVNEGSADIDCGSFDEESVDDIDCGTFDDGEPLLVHDSSPQSHGGMKIDGNASSITEDVTLEAHMRNPAAHQNLNVDGNSV